MNPVFIGCVIVLWLVGATIGYILIRKLTKLDEENEGSDLPYWTLADRFFWLPVSVMLGPILLFSSLVALGVGHIAKWIAGIDWDRESKW